MLAILVAVVGLSAVGVIVVGGRSSATPDQSAAAAPSTTTGASTAAAAPAVASAVASAATATPAAVVLDTAFDDPLPASGPGLTEPGILMMAVPAPDGSFDVIERIRLAGPVTVLTLRPAPLDRAGQQFAAVSAAASQVQVSAGDQPVMVPDAVVDAPIDLPVPSQDHFAVRYRLTGVTVRSTPSTAGRALAALGPLTGGVEGDLPVHVVVFGATVLGVSCPLLPFARQSCGSRLTAGTGIDSELPASVAVTTVQFDLPLP